MKTILPVNGRSFELCCVIFAELSPHRQELLAVRTPRSEEQNQPFAVLDVLGESGHGQVKREIFRFVVVGRGRSELRDSYRFS